MLKIGYCNRDISFARSAQSPAKEQSDSRLLQLSDKPDNVAQRDFSHRYLKNTRPGMLSHTAIDYSDWLEQFETKEEKALALKILQNYVYIDINNARIAFRKLHKDLEEEIDLRKTKFSTLGISKSGAFMSYLYRQANKMRSKGPVKHEHTDYANLLKEEYFLTSNQLQDVEFNKTLADEGFENIVLVDDILGNGDAFTEYLTPDVVESLKQYKKIYYVTLLKDPDGEKRIRKKFGDLDIEFKCAQEVYKYDSPQNKIFTDEEKVKIAEMIDKYGHKIDPALVNKYSRSKLFVTFDWNSPGNVPMLFNYSNDNWKGLFVRYNGLEKNDVGTNFNFTC